MTPHNWISVIACVGHLTLAVLAVWRDVRSPLARPLALLSIDMFLWNFAALAHAMSGERAWRWLEASTSPLATALVLHFILTFVGQRRALRGVLYAAYAASGSIAACSALAFCGVRWAQAFAGSATWGAVHLAVLLPVSVGSALLFVRHWHVAPSPAERARTLLLLVALSVASPLAVLELCTDFGVPALRWANLGTLLSSCVMGLVALRLHLLERELERRAMVQGVAVALASVLAYLALFELLGANTALLAFGTVAVTVALLAAARLLFAPFAVHKERLEHLATLGRFSAQLAHDLKNPLAALQGATQFLQGEVERGAPLQQQQEFLGLILEQVGRVNAVVATYQRLGRVEALRAPHDLNALVRDVLALQPFAAAPGVRLEVELGEALPPVALDRDLLSGALENVVRNAFEALPGEGCVTVRTAPATPEEPEGVVLTVRDTGVGMNARVLERVFDDFFTTKAQGSGLGLAFVRRVVEAHEGRVQLTSAEGQGTTLRLHLPRAA
ncbi:two-component sensor histidine kinase [Aggregicoccus sp. 17bor-14]|uniref:ATP-binding protein n=1 Tax=Myxococcaceae TaxID=31 RepID=UPI00129C3A6B|nr:MULTISPECIES: ATP-binding protein [Myxococcaceae]MBF5045116.1 two-component sensor histidine kinase [Simulacricoccus sp. 17bor-14]MRI90858.1 two-component sensor histidine kinase [Aggregicoccus sp. 17bor-14]